MKTAKDLLWIAFLLLASCTPAIGPNRPADNSPNLQPLSSSDVSVSAANNDFAFNLFRDIQKQNTGSNIFISPLSVSMALGMAMNGASASTQQSILNTIQFGNLKASDVDLAYKDLISLLTSMDKTVAMDLANSVWYDKKFTVKDTFATVISGDYSGGIQSLDFSDPASPQVINSWVESKTNQEIKDLINTIAPDEVMFLINAIYFKGTWTYQFDASQTKASLFTGENGASQQVPMMFAKAPKLIEFIGSKFIVVDIPYGNRQFSMTVVLPNPGSTVQQITQILSADSLNFWISHADSVSPELFLPKFKMEWKSDLKGNLVNMGMAMKGFPHFFEQPFSYEISRVIHQSSISVDETGSEAAAATAVGIETSVAIASPPKIEINRPFLYLIREKHSGVILFLGQLYMPPVD